MARISQPLFHPSSRLLPAFHVLSFPASSSARFTNLSLSSSYLSAARDGLPLPRGFRPLWRMQASKRNCLLAEFFSARSVQRLSRRSSPRKPCLASLLPLTAFASALRPHISRSPSKPSSLSSASTASLSSASTAFLSSASPASLSSASAASLSSASLSPTGHHAANMKSSVSFVRWAFSDRRGVSSLQRRLHLTSSSSVSALLPPLRRLSSSPRAASLASPSLGVLALSPARRALLAASSASASSSPPVSGFASLFQKTRRLLKRNETASFFQWQVEDSVLLLLSLSWIAVACGLFALFQWKTNTRDQRHPYLAEARRLVRVCD
ncbi:putative transmembrane protein [Toxoplasma gondii VAND]|uniref:Putative transmembrane protein n=1 Tax=Toxoplasma gondii VAND TaxID=933077 RepID=A0A086Q4C9_TOXGO|nr:putative transmembrane protein [Toxoplasma gondii VAND]